MFRLVLSFVKTREKNSEIMLYFWFYKQDMTSLMVYSC